MEMNIRTSRIDQHLHGKMAAARQLGLERPWLYDPKQNRIRTKGQLPAQFHTRFQMCP
jgi:hypothetical protein